MEIQELFEINENMEKLNERIQSLTELRNSLVPNEFLTYHQFRNKTRYRLKNESFSSSDKKYIRGKYEWLKEVLYKI